MAIESREIALTRSEIIKAMVLFSKRSNSPIPAYAQIGEFGTDGAGGVFLRLEADGRFKTYGHGVILPAVIYFCNQCNIPLPQQALKDVEWRGSDLALVIREWGFETPGLHLLAA